jgi:hypothetical protein
LTACTQSKSDANFEKERPAALAARIHEATLRELFHKNDDSRRLLNTGFH